MVYNPSTKPVRTNNSGLQQLIAGIEHVDRIIKYSQTTWQKKEEQVLRNLEKTKTLFSWRVTKEEDNG